LLAAFSSFAAAAAAAAAAAIRPSVPQEQRDVRINSVVCAPNAHPIPAECAAQRTAVCIRPFVSRCGLEGRSSALLARHPSGDGGERKPLQTARDDQINCVVTDKEEQVERGDGNHHLQIDFVEIFVSQHSHHLLVENGMY
jgi:hypothetical protein